MSDQNELTPERKKVLRNKHPLYSRLSGEVVWGLYEEQGFDAHDCGKAMDAFIEAMHATVATMDRLERDPRAFLAVKAGDTACPGCTAFSGRAVQASNPAWLQCLPPFGVGCKAACEALDESAVREEGYTIINTAIPERPACPLLCCRVAAGG